MSMKNLCVFVASMAEWLSHCTIVMRVVGSNLRNVVKFYWLDQNWLTASFAKRRSIWITDWRLAGWNLRNVWAFWVTAPYGQRSHGCVSTEGAFPLRLNFMKLTWSLNIMILLKDRGKKTGKTWDLNPETWHLSWVFRHRPNCAINILNEIKDYLMSILCFQPIVPLPAKKVFYPSLKPLSIYFVFLTKLGETPSPSLHQLHDCQLSSGVKSAPLGVYSGDQIWLLSLPF